MENLIGMWRGGFSSLFSDDSISFYTFFTVIFAECFYLRSFYLTFIATAFNIILLGYVINVIMFAWIKRCISSPNKDEIVASLYSTIFALLFIIGCIINFWTCIAMTAIPLINTFLCNKVRYIQDECWFRKRFTFAYYLSQVIIVGVPIIAFVICALITPTIPIFLKVIIPIIYVFTIPFIVLIEDKIGRYNIFDIAFRIKYLEK